MSSSVPHGNSLLSHLFPGPSEKCLPFTLWEAFPSWSFVTPSRLPSVKQTYLVCHIHASPENVISHQDPYTGVPSISEMGCWRTGCLSYEQPCSGRDCRLESGSRKQEKKLASIHSTDGAQFLGQGRCNSLSEFNRAFALELFGSSGQKIRPFKCPLADFGIGYLMYLTSTRDLTTFCIDRAR